MRFRSTRGESPQLGYSEALLQGLAPDGGLYIPQEWPAPDVAQLTAQTELPVLAQALLGEFAAGDVLAPNFGEIVRDAFNFPAPLKVLDVAGRLRVLELFHGPTAAFKDFGARFLAASLSRLTRPTRKTLRILVATSGDTGGAVAAAFHRRPGIEVIVLFPKGLVSPTQQQQLTCWGENIKSLAVCGTFDDCQRLVKAAFLDPGLRSKVDLSSANSINLGRLLPQTAYYAASSLAVQRETGEKACYIIPSGNLGNAVACIWAKQLGMPIDKIVLAHNANLTVPEYLSTGSLRARASVATLASAMDVGNPSNLERLLALYPGAAALAGALSAHSISDDQIRRRIRADRMTYGQIWCPHTATAAEVYALLSEQERREHHWILVATAHPAKFREIVEPLIGESVQVPENLRRLYDLPSHFSQIMPTLSDLVRATGSE
jgi:threonine synthase